LKRDFISPKLLKTLNTRANLATPSKSHKNKKSYQHFALQAGMQEK